MRDNKNEEPRPQDRSVLDRPLTIVLVMDTIGNKGNGTSNSALQYAHELERQGHHVRLVGIGAPEYPARVNKVPLVSWVAAKQQMQFAKPSDTLFRTPRRADAWRALQNLQGSLPSHSEQRAAGAHHNGQPSHRRLHHAIPLHRHDEPSRL